MVNDEPNHDESSWYGGCSDVVKSQEDEWHFSQEPMACLTARLGAVETLTLVA
jgi:hypothetical protein